MYPNKIIDIGSQYTKNLIFQHGYNALTFRERLNGNLWFKPPLKFIIITGNERINLLNTNLIIEPDIQEEEEEEEQQQQQQEQQEN